MDFIRGNDGEMEPTRSAFDRKNLLPWEIQICEALGISSDEYFEYFDLVQQAKQERNAAYDHVPDVVNDPGTIGLVLTVVGTALSVASALLAPKPRAPEQQKRRGDVIGDDVRGRTKYAPLRQFDSVQELATLSDVVPLVYTNKADNSLLGGVRVESQLLWSQIKNLHTYQIIKVLLLFSGGEVARRPDFESYAFGSQKIQSYGRSRIDMSFAYGKSFQGPLLRNPDQESDKPVDYPEATYREEQSQSEYFSLYNNGSTSDNRPEGNYLDFCGVQTPSTSPQFGQYGPIANGTGYRYPWQWPGKGDGDADQKERIYSIRTKAVFTYFYLGSRITWDNSNRFKLRLQSGPSETAAIVGREPYASDPEIRTRFHYDNSGYKLIQGNTQDVNSNFAELSGGFGSATSAADENCEEADSSITLGDLFLLGDLVVKCTAINRGDPWETENRFDKEYTFEFEDSYSKYSIFSDSTRKNHIDTDPRQIFRPDYMYPLQRVSIGAASTTRKIDAVEIGLKSVVWRRLSGFPNVNQHPNSKVFNDLAKEGARFEFGTVDRYTPRMSFFRVEYRAVEATGDNWVDISPGHPFAVRGSTPQGEYSAIKIFHDKRGQFEYRFIPISGNCFADNTYAKPINLEVNLLNGAQSFNRTVASANGLDVFFRGRTLRLDNSNTNSQNMVVKTWPESYRNQSDSEKFNRNLVSNDIMCDMYSYDAEDFSHRTDPEHEIVYVNEMIKNTDTWYTPEGRSKQYDRLAYVGMTVAASRDFSSLSDVSAYFTKGIQVERLTQMGGGDADTEHFPNRPSAYNATNLFPEIAYDLLTNKGRGAGELVGRGEVHEGKMREAALFCQANGFLWDGVISDASNIRDFIYEQAVFCLLDFTIIGGMFALVPTVPYTSDYRIDRDASFSNGRIRVRALFTDGNMRNYKTTFLASAERENFVAEVKYREERLNGFPEMRSFRIRLKELENDDRNEYTINDTVEVFDMTQFCTNKQHAIDFAKFALRVREKSRPRYRF